MTKDKKILLIITGEYRQGKIKVYFDKVMDGMAEVVEALGVSDAMQKLSYIPVGLILLEDMQTVDETCSIIQHIREFYKIPIIVFQAQADKVTEPYIMAGADAVIPESFGKAETKILAYALLRRYKWGNSENRNHVIQIDGLYLNPAYHSVNWKDSEIKLSSREFELLYLLASKPGEVYSYNQIYREIWKEHPEGDIANMIWCLVGRTKRKINAAAGGIPELIHGIRNEGYYFKIDWE